MTSEKQHIQYELAKAKATEQLNKQKLKTGVAILGSPLPTLDNDVKFQGPIQDQSIEAGETWPG